MIHRPRQAALLLTAALTALAAPLTFAQQAGEPIRDRTNFIPFRKHQPLPGKVVGVLLYDGQPVLHAEGRSGPNDQLVLGRNGASYRWVYVPTPNVKPVINNLQVPVGDRGEKKVYQALDMARPKSVQHLGVTEKYTLVEVSVNDGLGSPPNDSFVATNIKVLEGTPNFPIKTAQVIEDLKRRHADHLQRQNAVIERQLANALKAALKDKKVTGPRQKSELMFVTWMEDKQRLRVHFRTTISDGAYEMVKGGPMKILPPQKGPPQKRPREFQTKVGTTVTLEFGTAYEVGRDGRLVATHELPFQATTQQVNQRMIVGPRNPPALPLPPVKR